MESFWSAVTHASTICTSISALNWKQTESTPSAVWSSTGSAICHKPAPRSNCRDWRSRSGARVESESRNCSSKRPPASKINRTLTPPPHERFFYHRKLLGDFVSLQRYRIGTALNRSSAIASSRKIEPADGGPTAPIIEDTESLARHSLADHKPR